MTFDKAKPRIGGQPGTIASFNQDPLRTVKPSIAESTGSFFVGGRYVETASGKIMSGQAYIHYRHPAKQPDRLPIVMIHGAHQTGTNFESTPDGRPGWADYFVSNQFSVYLVDQPPRGRSPLHYEIYGASKSIDVRNIEQKFTAPKNHNLYPQAHLHTQWPGSGIAGDPFFDQFYASQVPQIPDPARIEELMRAAGAALLDKIGPAILLTHSQSGVHGWQIADARPELVKAILAVEPNGPPFFDNQWIGPPDYHQDGAFSKPYGLTALPLAYDPPVVDPSVDLVYQVEDLRHEGVMVPIRLQREPARTLVNLVDVPVLVVTGEASSHANTDIATVRFLRQAGVEVTHQQLAEIDICGNGHMMMLEKNNLEIASAMHDWLQDNGLASTNA